VRLARDAVEAWVRRTEVLETQATGEMARQVGVFISIKKHDLLRGCIGSVEATQEDLAREIVINAIAAAGRDPRFEPITEDELPELTYSVDVLGEPEAVDDPGALDPHRYGLIVQNGERRGLLLPDLDGVDDVPTQIDIARSKAGILPAESIDLYRFQVERYT
jgi:AmmeMemoRadiSam system protein A